MPELENWEGLTVGAGPMKALKDLVVDKGIWNTEIVLLPGSSTLSIQAVKRSCLLHRFNLLSREDWLTLQA